MDKQFLMQMARGSNNQSVLSKLIRHDDPNIAFTVARFTRHQSILRELSKHPDPNVMWGVAINDQTHPDILHDIAARSIKGDTHVIAYNIALHRNVHKKTIDLLAKHPNPLVRQEARMRLYGWQERSEAIVHRVLDNE